MLLQVQHHGAPQGLQVQCWLHLPPCSSYPEVKRQVFMMWSQHREICCLWTAVVLGLVRVQQHFSPGCCLMKGKRGLPTLTPCVRQEGATSG